MCGIVGYVGPHPALGFLLEGLHRLEYRGYDSAGVALLDGGRIDVRRKTGRVSQVEELCRLEPPVGTTGIGHTRWATHGVPSDVNAHPHTGGNGEVVLVHNGVIENYGSLRSQLISQGYTFHSATDTEVVAHLVAAQLKREIKLGGKASAPQTGLRAVETAVSQLKGTFGLAVLFRDAPGLLIAARLGSPLVIGVGKDEFFLASDASPLVGHTERVVYLKDHEIAVITAKDFEIVHRETGSQTPDVRVLEQTSQDTELGEFEHYMLKEIFEQPNTVRDALRGRLSAEEATAKLGGLDMTNAELREIERIVLSGCGTAFHAAMVGEYLIESLARIPVECEFASELRYRNLPMTKDTLVFVISQSGETADTLAALRESQRKGHRTLGICNNVASTIARESDGGVYMHAGPEIGVAATKSFTSQLTIMTLLALLLGRIHFLSYAEGMEILAELEKLPEKVARTLELDAHIQTIAKKYAKSQNFLFMGRQANYPIALEGALKLKEISYISASGFPSAELKHGVIALVNEETPSVFIAPRDAVFEKNLSNIEEVKARKGPVIAVGTEGDEHLAKVADDVILIPKAPDYLTPLLASITLQLLAYHIAVELGCDVDKPRNLAKSVTVE